jgi:glycosyltransferase involved in cell wall biosynthesis
LGDSADKRVHVVEEGCDHLPPPDHDGARRLLEGLGVQGRFVLTVSTLEPRKNLDRLMAAHRAADLGMPLVVVGPSGWGPSVQPQQDVVLAGYVDEAVKAALLGTAEVMAYVPLVEGFGLPAVEAMKAGAPVVASPMPSTAGAALEVDPLSVPSIAEGLALAVTDEGTRARLLEAGERRAAQLTWAAAARRHVELWEGLAR